MLVLYNSTYSLFRKEYYTTLPSSTYTLVVLINATNATPIDQDSGKPEVKSAALKEFDEMQARIASAVQEAEQNLQKTKETHQGSHKQHEAGDAWGVTSTKDDKTTWEGFDDNFSKVVVVEVAEVAPTEKSSIPVIKMFQTDEEEVDTGNPFAAASSNDLDLLGSIGVTSSAVSSYSLVNLGEMTSSTPNSVPGQFDTLVPLCCDGMTTSVSKDDVFGLTNQIAAQSGAAKIKIASNFDLFGLEDEVVTSEVKTNDTPLFTPAYGIDDATAADYDDPFVIRPVTDKIAQDDNVIKDAIDAAFGNPFEVNEIRYFISKNVLEGVLCYVVQYIYNVYYTFKY